MPILNPKFEEPGAHSGEAEHWTLMALTSLESIAGFGEPELARENFERWHELWRGLEEVTVVRAFFDDGDAGFDAFESGYLFVTELLEGHLEQGSFSPDSVEDLDHGWPSVGFAWSWADIDAVAGLFDGAPREDFEDRWRGNGRFLWSWLEVRSERADFAGGATDTETFTGRWDPTETL